jgi:hypothetical protein
MEQLRKIIKKILLENYLTSEDLETVKSFMSEPKIAGSEEVKTNKYEIKASKLAKLINDTGTANTDFTVENSKITSYMLEVLVEAVKSEKRGEEFMFPGVNEKSIINKKNIIDGIMKYFSSVLQPHGLSMFISPIFSVSERDLNILLPKVVRVKTKETLDEMIWNILNNVETIIDSYIEKGSGSFINYFRTPFAQAVHDAFKVKSKTISLDEPYGDKSTRGDMMTGEEDGERDSYNDFNTQKVDGEDDERYSPEISDKLAVILKLNFDINQELKSKDDLYEFFRLRIVGEEGGIKDTEQGSEVELGKTMSYGDIKRAFKSGSLNQSLANNISKKLLSFAYKFLVSGYNITKKGEGKQDVPARTDLLEKFRKEHPESFNEKGQLIASPALFDFLDLHVKEDKLRPKTLFKRIRREIQDYFKDNPARFNKLNQLTNDASIMNPETNKPYNGIDYLNSLLKARTEQKQSENFPITEEILDEDILDESMLDEDEDEKFTFNDILRIAKASVNYEAAQLQEARKNIRALILKSSIK